MQYTIFFSQLLHFAKNSTFVNANKSTIKMNPRVKKVKAENNHHLLLLFDNMVI